MSAGKIFRQYIGYKSPDDFFPVEIINEKISEFHFILASASDYDPSTEKFTGEFHETWNVHAFSAESIKSLKKNKQNVKVIISIGGRVPGSNSPAKFDPEDIPRWIENAKNSLYQIIFVTYQSDGPNSTVIDGFDIAYESIESGAFADCMGQVIDELKRVKSLVVSIAPSLDVLRSYITLCNHRTSDIRWVNYKYYCEELSTVEDFFTRSRQLVSDFPEKPILAGFSTDPNDNGNISRQVFFTACREMLSSLPGIFVWDADNSKNQVPPFSVEIDAQRILTNE